MLRIIIICILLNIGILNAKDNKNDYEYTVALAYLSGAKGATKEKKIIPKCPYERCSNLTKVIIVTKKDYKKALEWFNRSVKLNNTDAAIKAYETLYKQLDYKNSTPDAYLIKLLKKRFGISLDQYYENIQNYLIVMQKDNSCKANYYLYETFKNGYFKIAKNEKIAEKYRNKTQHTCSSESFFWMVTQKKK